MVTAKGYIIRGPKISLQQPEQLMKLVSGDSHNGEKTVLLDLHQVLI
jgi:hypothetical protein